MKSLTTQQKRVLAVVADHVAANGFPPTMREIGQALELPNVTAVRCHLEALEKKGYITKEPNKARSICVVHAPSPVSRLKQKLHEVFQTDVGVAHRIVYGLAWATRQRRPFLIGDRQRRLQDAFQREAIEHGWRLSDCRIAPDHVALAVEVWPNHSPELVVRRFRAAGKRARSRQGGALADGRLWEQGYVATTDLGLMDAMLADFLSKVPQAHGP